MNKAVLLLAVLLAGCTREDRAQTDQDAKKLGQDLRRDIKKADVVVTQEMKDAQQRVKRDVDEAKKK
jgi:hypothetical protein